MNVTQIHIWLLCIQDEVFREQPTDYSVAQMSVTDEDRSCRTSHHVYSRYL